MDKRLAYVLAFIEEYKNSYKNKEDKEIYYVLHNLQKNLNIIVKNES